MTFDPAGAVGALVAFIIGACVGSFVNVTAYRWPRQLSIIRPRSFCPHCQRPLPVWANVPLLAWIVLRGRCHRCGGAIPFRDFLTELALAVAALYLVLSFPLADAAARFIFCAMLYVIALIDLETRMIPVAVAMAGIPLGVLAAAFAMPEVGWLASLLGVVAGTGLLGLVSEAYRRLRGRVGLGQGDLWLIALIGAFVGWIGVAFTLMAGALLGLLVGIPYLVFAGPSMNEVAAPARGPNDHQPRERLNSLSAMMATPLPFAPFLALAAAVFALFQPELMRWYGGS